MMLSEDEWEAYREYQSRFFGLDKMADEEKRKAAEEALGVLIEMFGKKDAD